MKNINNLKKIKKGRFLTGFTLIEIVVVIGIMVIFTVIVYVSLDKSKAQNRDQQRVADISNIQLALEIYFSRNKTYPQKLWRETGDPTNQFTYLVPDTLPSKLESPTSDPLGGYHYFPIGGSSCYSYHLWTTLETKISILDSKKGFNSLDLTPCSNSDVIQYYANARADASSTPMIYDVTPQ